MLPTEGSRLPTGVEWSYEVKWDGPRVLAIKDQVGIRLLSDQGEDVTGQHPSVVAALRGVSAAGFMLDGKIIALDASGKPCTRAQQASPDAVAYCAFDLLSFGGESERWNSLDIRRQRLKRLTDGTRVILSESLPGSPKDIEKRVRELGLGGVVAKRRDSPYLPGERSDAWVEVTFAPEQAFLVGGYLPNEGNFESILVGYFHDGQLHVASRVRAGLTPAARAEIFRDILDQPIRKCPFANLVGKSPVNYPAEGMGEHDLANMCWVKPTLVVQVSFAEWTEQGLLRDAKFVGIRRGMNPRDVVREPRHGRR